MTERLRQMVERALVRPETLQKIREVVKLHHDALVLAMTGARELDPGTIKAIQAAGIPRWSGPSAVESGVDLGIFLAASPDPFQDEVTWEDFRERLGKRETPLSYAEAYAVRDAEQNAARYCRGLGNTVDEATHSMILEADRGRRDEIERAFRAETTQVINLRETAGQLKSRLGHATGEWTRDLHRIATTEIHNAMETGRGAGIEGKHGAEAQVAKIPSPGACDACLEFYTVDGVVPRIYKLSQLKGQTNARDPVTGKGRKRSSWVPTLESLHPWCRCSLISVPAGFAFDETGELLPKSMIKNERRSP